MASHARLAGLLKSDLATLEIELALALAALDRRALAHARRLLAEALRLAAAGQERQADDAACAVDGATGALAPAAAGAATDT